MVGSERRARHAAERSLLASAHAKAVYRELFDSNTSPILVVDGNGSVIDANATAVRGFGDSGRLSPNLLAVLASSVPLSD